MRRYHKNSLWLSFLSVITLCTVWYTGVAIIKLNRFYSLSKETTVSSSAWSVKAIASDIYVPEVNYSFYNQKSLFNGMETFSCEHFKNAWAAEKALSEFAETKRIVWYSPDNPYFSSLQKKFPLKESLSALALWAVLLYFVCLGFYVTKYQK